jgi:altronate hydrolase
MKNNALRINTSDNVAIALDSLKKGDDIIIDGKILFSTTEDIQAGHKIAIEYIALGDNIYRYGEPILEATRAIFRGEWVHVHNTQPVSGDLTT